jgi:curli biogenesis system outer membrane secretion channel CsgG
MNRLFSALLAISLSTVSKITAAQSGDLPMVAVTTFETTFDRNSRSAYSASKPENFEVMIETQLLKVGRFRIYERNRLDQILSEQGLQSAIGAQGGAVSIDGVDYLIYGSITDYTNEVEEFNTGDFQSIKVTTRFGVDLKVADALTGEIRRAETITVVTQGGSAVGTGSFAKADINSSALVDAQRKAAKLVTSVITESIFPMRVVDTENKEIYLNYGEAILTVGDTLKVMKQGRALIDPETGKTLGSTETVVASIRVIETTDEFSKAEIISGESPSAGDIVRMSLSNENAATEQQRAPRGRKI